MEISNDTINQPTREEYWRSIFDKYDSDRDGYLQLSEFREIINTSDYGNEISDYAVENIMELADEDETKDLNFHEFIDIIQAKHLNSIFGRFVNSYIDVINGGRSQIERIRKGIYEQQYSCENYPWFIFIISLLEISCFILDKTVVSYISDKETFIIDFFGYDPSLRYQFWRYLSYMLVHEGTEHIIFNVLIQIGLGVPLEMVHRSYRVMLVYFAGVIAGSLGSSLTDPWAILIGASGGVYALITAHLATLIMNWREMEFAYIQMLIFVMVSLADIGNAVYQRYYYNDRTSYAAHFFGALAGLLVSINVLRNLIVHNWEMKLARICVVIFFILLVIGIALNMFWTSHFPS